MNDFALYPTVPFSLFHRPLARCPLPTGGWARITTSRRFAAEELTRNKSVDPSIASSPQAINESKRLFVSALEAISTASTIERIFGHTWCTV